MSRATYRRIASPARCWPYGNCSGRSAAIHKFRRACNGTIRAAARREIAAETRD